MLGYRILLAAALLAAAAAPVSAQQAPIAVADGETSGTRIEVTELSRTSGDTLTLKLRLVNDSGEAISPYELMEASDLRNLHLIDAAGRKKYLVVADSKGTCVCSSDLTNTLDAGKSLNLWAKFPAPPAEVKEVSIVIPHFIPADAPISD